MDSAANTETEAEEVGDGAPHKEQGTDSSHRGSILTREQVWRTLEKSTFAVLSYRTPSGDPRSSGVVYKTLGRRLYVAVAPDSWKAKHVERSGRVAVTVPVRRGGLLSLVFPIPPATVSFHGKAAVYRPDSKEAARALERLSSLVPSERRAAAAVIAITPEASFLTYGVGVSLGTMRSPMSARARVPVG
jgi:Pyridoxamine 5'-phosphate oxidase